MLAFICSRATSEGSEACRAFANFSKDGKSVYVCSDTDGHTQRDPATGKVWSARPQVKLQGWRNINAGSPASESMFCVTNAYCLRIETEGGKTTARFPLPSGASFAGSIAYLREREILAVVAAQSRSYGILQFWDVNSGDLLRSLPVPSAGNPAWEDANWSIVANPISGDFVITRGAEMKIWRLSRSQGEKTLPIESDSVFDDFAFLNELNTVAGAFRVSKDKQEDVGVGVMNIESRATYYPLAQTFTAHKRRRCILTTDRSTKLISTLTQKLNPTRYPLTLFRLEKEGATEITLPEVFPLEGHAHLSPKGDAIWAGNCVVETGATSSVTKLTKIDRQGIIEPPVREKTPRWVGDTHVVEIVDLKPPKGSNNIPPTRHLLLCDVESGRRAAVISAPFAKTLSSSPDGTLIAEGGSDKMLRIRDAKTLTEQQVLRVHDQGVSAVAWHPKLPLIATASEDRAVKIWNLSTGAMVEEFGFFEAPDRLFWSSDGTQIAVRRILLPLQIFSPKSCQ